jgi:hypothetical protein
MSPQIAESADCNNIGLRVITAVLASDDMLSGALK